MHVPREVLCERIERNFGMISFREWVGEAADHVRRRQWSFNDCHLIPQSEYLASRVVNLTTLLQMSHADAAKMLNR